jgi:cell division protein ZapE
MTATVRSAYDHLLAAHELKADPAQARAVESLERLAASMRPASLFSRILGNRSDGPAGV